MGFHLPKVGWTPRQPRKEKCSENQDVQVDSGKATIGSGDKIFSCPKRLMSKVLAKGEKVTRSLYHRVHHEAVVEHTSSGTPNSPAAALSRVPDREEVGGANVEIYQGIDVGVPIAHTVLNGGPRVRDFAYPVTHTQHLPEYAPQVQEDPSPILNIAPETVDCLDDEDQTVRSHVPQVTLPDAVENGRRSDIVEPELVPPLESANQSQIAPIHDVEIASQTLTLAKTDVVHQVVIPTGIQNGKEATVTVEEHAGASPHIQIPCSDAKAGHDRNVSECTLVCYSTRSTSQLLDAVTVRSSHPGRLVEQSNPAKDDSNFSKVDRTHFEAATGRGKGSNIHGSDTDSTLIAADEDTALELLLKTRQQGYENDMEDLRDEFAGKIKELELEHAELLTFREQMHQIVVKQLQRDVKLKNREKQRLEETLAETSRTYETREEERDLVEEQISEFISEFEGLKQRSNGKEAQLEKEIWYLQEVVKGMGKQLCNVTDKYDSCVRNYETTCNDFRELVGLQRSRILSIEDELTKKKDPKPQDQTTSDQAMSQVESLKQQLADMTRHRDILAQQNVVQQQNAEVWESKAHCLQGVQEGILDPSSYNPEGLLAFKNSELKKLEECSAALLTEHQRLESTSKFDAEVYVAKIASFMATTKLDEETIAELQEQKTNYQQANEGLLANLKSRISDKNIVRTNEQYHQLIRGENLKLADQVRELQLRLNAANEKISDEEIRQLKTAREKSDLAKEHSGCDGARRELENRVSTLQFEVDAIPQDYEKVIKPMTAKIEGLELRLQQAAAEKQRLLGSSLPEIVRTEFDRKDREILSLREALERSQNEKAELENAYEEQTYYRGLDLGYAQCHEDTLENVRHELKKVEAERDDLQEQLSFCKPMRRYEFRDYKAEIAEARALTQAREEELRVSQDQHKKDLEQLHSDCNLIYNLQNLGLHICGRMKKLENLLGKHDLALGDTDARSELFAWCKELLSNFKSDEAASEVGENEAVLSSDEKETLFCEAGEIPEIEHVIHENIEPVGEDVKDDERHILQNQGELSEDNEEKEAVGPKENNAEGDQEWGTDDGSEGASSLHYTQSSWSEAQEAIDELERLRLSCIVRDKQLASPSSASSGWRTVSSSA